MMWPRFRCFTRRVINELPTSFSLLASVAKPLKYRNLHVKFMFVFKSVFCKVPKQKESNSLCVHLFHLNKDGRVRYSYRISAIQ